jgi:hypothetical protein
VGRRDKEVKKKRKGKRVSGGFGTFFYFLFVITHQTKTNAYQNDAQTLG